MVAALGLCLPSVAWAQAAPDAMPDTLSDNGGAISPRATSWTPNGPAEDRSYRGLLAAGYLLAIPSAAMTGGVGVLLPVGMHYYHHNADGGLRALFGIVGGVTVGAVAGGLLEQPEDGFEFTRGMLIGMMSGFFVWGVVDVAFFASGGHGPGDRLGIARRPPISVGVDVLPGASGAALRVRAQL